MREKARKNTNITELVASNQIGTLPHSLIKLLQLRLHLSNIADNLVILCL